ncbi:MAG: TMEM165/GDT1 family protein [Candidatus Adiutrix sp.]|jgi:putative Ca2+/H+ antiporter (TMEM165/GDT1 family)|nr:TMEM165/GDT1 family protein [Candidatus Adiutrix sp.]
MRLKVMAPIFSSVFMAELGDKTQVATVLFIAGGTATALEVFLASSLALVASTLLAVLFGAAVGRLISPRLLKVAAGLVFMIIGAYFICQGFKTV